MEVHQELHAVNQAVCFSEHMPPLPAQWNDAVLKAGTCFPAVSGKVPLAT